MSCRPSSGSTSGQHMRVGMLNVRAAQRGGMRYVATSRRRLPATAGAVLAPPLRPRRRIPHACGTINGTTCADVVDHLPASTSWSLAATAGALYDRPAVAAHAAAAPRGGAWCCVRLRPSKPIASGPRSTIDVGGELLAADYSMLTSGSRRAAEGRCSVGMLRQAVQRQRLAGCATRWCRSRMVNSCRIVGPKRPWLLISPTSFKARMIRWSQQRTRRQGTGRGVAHLDAGHRVLRRGHSRRRLQHPSVRGGAGGAVCCDRRSAGRSRCGSPSCSSRSPFSFARRRHARPLRRRHRPVPVRGAPQATGAAEEGSAEAGGAARLRRRKREGGGGGAARDLHVHLPEGVGNLPAETKAALDARDR